MRIEQIKFFSFYTSPFASFYQTFKKIKIGKRKLYVKKENEIINYNPNGKNINYKCGSTDLSSLIHELKVRDYDIGVAFDGDGDRIMVVDKYNRIYEGDFLTYIFALDLFDNNLLLKILFDVAVKLFLLFLTTFGFWVLEKVCLTVPPFLLC